MIQNPLPSVESPPRPRVAESMIQEAASEVVQRVSGIRVMDIVSHYRHPMDGYDLAMKLNMYEGFDVSREEMETLDEVESYVRHSLKEAEKAWFETYDIQPPYPIGTRIKQGVIAGISDYDVATYEVKENGCTQDGRYLLIKFESAVALEVTDVNA